MKTDNRPLTSAKTVIEKRMERLHFRGELAALILKLLSFCIIALAVFTFLFGITIQRGEGMYPRVRDGDIMLFYRQPTSLVVGDIVLYTRDGTRYAGRIVAKAGDVVEMSDEGRLVVNGAIQYEEICYETYAQGSALVFPYTVPEDSYFLLGDMRTGARDSRDFGAVSEDGLDGKLIAILRRRGL